MHTKIILTGLKSFLVSREKNKKCIKNSKISSNRLISLEIAWVHCFCNSVISQSTFLSFIIFPIFFFFFFFSFLYFCIFTPLISNHMLTQTDNTVRVYIIYLPVYPWPLFLFHECWPWPWQPWDFRSWSKVKAKGDCVLTSLWGFQLDSSQGQRSRSISDFSTGAECRWCPGGGYSLDFCTGVWGTENFNHSLF